MTRVVLVSAVALIDVDGRVLMAQRPEGKSMAGLWEFPGGKVAEGESNAAALSREIAEELGVEVLSASHFQYIEHDYPEHAVAIEFYRIDEWSGEPAGVEGQRIRWVDRATLHEQALLPADAPVIESLQRL